MKKRLLLLVFIYLSANVASQTITPTDGDWSKQLVVLRGTKEAACMIRVGDIDNLGFGWEEGFIPFSGRSTGAHNFPWEVNPVDAAGTDMIIIPSGYIYGSDEPTDGYTAGTQRPGNNPAAIIIPLKDIKGIPVTTAWMQLFIDDFQATEFNSKFQVKINGLRFTEAEKIINAINQTGPIGKFITLRLTDEILQQLATDSTLRVFIDDPTSKKGDGFAIDFVKLLINPTGVIYKGGISGKVIDKETQQPISNANAQVKEYGSAQTNAEGYFMLSGIPAGLAIVTASASGYRAAEKQADIISEETNEGLLLELSRSGKVSYNNNTLQEGDYVVMNTIQFEVNSASLLLQGKQELDKLTVFLQQNPGVEILLSGFTSAEGSAVLNRELSLKRVRNCKNYLVQNGIEDGRITIKGFGPDNPVAANDTEVNRAKNRRVEMKITKL